MKFFVAFIVVAFIIASSLITAHGQQQQQEEMVGQKEVVVGPPKGEREEEERWNCRGEGHYGGEGWQRPGQKGDDQRSLALARAAEPGGLARGAVAPNI